MITTPHKKAFTILPIKNGYLLMLPEKDDDRAFNAIMEKYKDFMEQMLNADENDEVSQLIKESKKANDAKTPETFNIDNIKPIDEERIIFFRNTKELYSFIDKYLIDQRGYNLKRFDE